MGTSRDSSAHNIFPIELSQHGLNRVHSASSPKEAIRSATEDIQGRLQQHISLLCTAKSHFERQLCEAATQLKPMCRSAQGFQLELLQEELDKRGYAVELKVVAPDEAFAAKQGPGHILENLHHQYLGHCIIEPRCREQFQLVRATPAYQEVLGRVPEVFVGSPRRLYNLVDALAPCVAEAFAANSTPLPPWRRKLSMLTKWNLKSTSEQQQQQQATGAHRMPAYARDLQLLQEALDKGTMPTFAAAPDHHLAAFYEQLAKAQSEVRASGAQTQQQGPAALLKRTSRGGTVHMVPPLQEGPQQVQTRDGPMQTLFPWLYKHANVPAEEASSHAGSQHRRRSLGRSRSRSTAQDSSRHEGSRREGSKHEGSRREGSRREGSKHEGSKHEGSRHQGSPNVNLICTPAGSPHAASLLEAAAARPLEGPSLRDSLPVDQRRPASAFPACASVQEERSPRPAVSLLARALEKVRQRGVSSPAGQGDRRTDPERRE
ncbi:hypothetical protein WJX73_004332 [Symbiochloris irregularis]|uniref:Uncharacterized protein n=1 Tax=Symbiochloris irregularis TaxID=706552 RepID=A0AAW1PDQ2_9CHLO